MEEPGRAWAEESWEAGQLGVNVSTEGILRMTQRHQLSTSSSRGAVQGVGSSTTRSNVHHPTTSSGWAPESRSRG